MGTNLKLKKQSWFDKGATSFATIQPDLSTGLVYPCPICLTLFTREALIDGRLCAEDVPPKSIGGRPLLLTCKSCNNKAGESIDADAKDREDLREALAGRQKRRVSAIIGGRTVRGDVDLGTGKLEVHAHINSPGTRDHLRDSAPINSQITVDFGARSELGKNISWLKAGYLVLVAEYGFGIAFDLSMVIVRHQIMDYNERKMVTFLREGSADLPVSDRLICRVLSPTDHRGWAVRIGRFWLDYPIKGDMTFYDRLARHSGVDTPMTVKVMQKPTNARFGLDETTTRA